MNNEQMQLESIEIISYAVFDMRKLYNRLLYTNESRKQLKEILSTLLSGMKTISNHNQNIELVQSTLDVVEQILDTFNSLDEGATLKAQRKGDSVFKDAIEDFNELYVKLTEEIEEKSQH